MAISLEVCITKGVRARETSRAKYTSVIIVLIIYDMMTCRVRGCSREG